MISSGSSSPMDLNTGNHYISTLTTILKILMDSVEEFIRIWVMRDGVELNTLSEWDKSIRSLILRRIHKVKFCLMTRPKLVLKDKKANKSLSSLHDKYVVVPADKAFNNSGCVCRSYYNEWLIKELGIFKNSGNPPYNNASFDKATILANYKSLMPSMNIPIDEEYDDLSTLYWIPVLHMNPCRERYIAGSSTCLAKVLSITIANIVFAVKTTIIMRQSPFT